MPGWSGRQDTFARDRLPPAEDWPDLLLEGFDYPERLNAAVELTDRQVERGFGDRTALIGNGRRRTYKELSDWTNRLARALIETYGVRPGDRVLIRSANNPAMVACWLAATKAGAVVVNTMPMLRAGELTQIVDKAEIGLALCDTRLMDELVRQRKRDLTIIANDNAVPGVGVGKLVSAGLVRKTIASHIGLNPETQRKMIEGAIEVELVPQGTLIERIRSGGFGLGGVLTPTGVGTVVEEGKRKLAVNGREYLLEIALRADFALVQAFLADYQGNLAYALTARNFNPVIALAADRVIVEAEHIVPVGLIAPDHVVTPAAVVDYLLTAA